MMLFLGRDDILAFNLSLPLNSPDALEKSFRSLTLKKSFKAVIEELQVRRALARRVISEAERQQIATLMSLPEYQQLQDNFLRSWAQSHRKEWENHLPPLAELVQTMFLQRKKIIKELEQMAPP